MKHPVTDKAQVSIDFPEKFYVGSFGRDSSLDVSADGEGVHIYLERKAPEIRRVGFHLHHYLLADLLASLGEALAADRELDDSKKEALRDAASVLAKALGKRRRRDPAANRGR